MKASLGLNGIAVACEKDFLILDEYLEENPHLHAQVYFPLKHIYRLNFNCPWLRSLALRIN